LFETRLKVLLILLALPALAVIARLAQMQVLHRSTYANDAQRMLIRKAKYFPCLRGTIVDRTGRLLASDATAWDICVHYAIIAGDVEALRDLQRKRAKDRRWRGFDDGLRAEIEESWQLISEMTATPREHLAAEAEDIRAQVLRVKASVSARRGVETVVEEERTAHPVVRGLSQEQQVAASVRLARYFWIEVLPSHTRQYAGGEAMSHILGRLGPVDAETVERDPNREDDLARYRLSDMQGISGVEALGESCLRGRRGKLEEDVTGRATSQPIEPVNGKAFRITIDHQLQETLYAQLAAAVEETQFRTGGCAVLLHVPTRQVLAMVDYPSVDPAASPEEKERLAKDKQRMPYLFRAGAEYYPPGSLVKPMLLVAALTDQLITPETRFVCHGKLFSESPGWACTGFHGSIDPVTAVQHSCNVYYYHVGQLVGVPRLGEWLARFGFGRVTGLGIPGEKPGILPQEASAGAARNVGIGQGQFSVTPAQAVNMIATLATGVYRPLTLWLDDPDPSPETRLPVPENWWRLARDGMYKVANEPGGTAYGEHRAKLDDPDYVLLGKTGSAEVARGRTIESTFFCHFPDGRVEEIVAPEKEDVLARYPPQEQPKITGWRSYTRYPPDPLGTYTHAWFAGYLAPKNRRLDAVGPGDLHFAIAVVIEFTGHGGEVAAPVARTMLQSALIRYRGEDGSAAREAS